MSERILSISKAIQVIKGGSSKWVHETFAEHRLFAWQEEYGAFSVSVSQLDRTIQYIRDQEKHHKKMNVSRGVSRVVEEASHRI